MNFAELISSDRIRLRTYERGVEGETLSCGTGAAATAFAAIQIFGIDNKVTILPKSLDQIHVAIGEFLEVSAPHTTCSMALLQFHRSIKQNGN